MRKLKLQVQLSANGFMAGPNGEMDFFIFDWSDDLKDYTKQITATIDTIILGRKLAEGFIPFWASNPEMEGASVFNETPKIVFSKSLQSLPWPDVKLAGKDLKDEILSLKNSAGKDIMAYGGVSFVSSLMKEDLIDEYHLYYNPVVIPEGLSPFSQLFAVKNLKLVSAKQHHCGITVACFQPQRS